VVGKDSGGANSDKVSGSAEYSLTKNLKKLTLHFNCPQFPQKLSDLYQTLQKLYFPIL
jgi:hypothetical protein